MKKKNIGIFVMLVLATIIISVTYAWFLHYSAADAEINAEIAFYIFETESQQITLNSIAPGQTCTYNITVSNYKDDFISQVDMEYEIIMQTTTNLPLKYELIYSENDEALSTSEELFEDKVDGVYYRNIRFGSQEEQKKLLSENGKQIHTYKLNVTFNGDGETTIGSEYSDILELIEITIDSNQIENQGDNDV